jgi:NitT/TauT family transport system permease protein
MIPILDIAQGIPVLAFLPGLVLALVGLFPRSNVGIELACILAIFTGQAWNMTFSYYGSIRAIPNELIEVARLHRFGPWRRFSQLELPSAMIGLVWNSMMSMAGGWFFLTVVENFTLPDANGVTHDFRLPGVGSYMNEAYHDGNVVAMVGACVAMVIMIVLIDQLLWRPLIAWSQKFKLEDTDSAERPTSWVYDFVRRSHIVAWFTRVLRPRFEPRAPVASANGNGGETIGLHEATERAARIANAAGLVIAVAVGVAALVGAYHLALMLMEVTPRDWLDIVESMAWTSLRVLATMVIGAAWAVPAGIAIGRSPRLSRILQPVIQVVASFPIPMLFAPIAAGIVLLGIPFGAGCTFLMLLGSQWYILFNVVAGAMAVPQDLREVAEVYGLRGFKRFRIVYLSGIFPYLVTGLITAAGGAWNASIISEYVDRGKELGALTAPGIGSYLSLTFANHSYHLLAAGVLVLSIELVLLNRFLWKPLYKLADERFALNR